MAKAGANNYTFHVEATSDVEGCIEKIRLNKMKVMMMIATIVIILLSYKH